MKDFFLLSVICVCFIQRANSQAEIKYIKVIDTVFLDGFVVSEKTSNEIRFVTGDELDINFKNYRKFNHFFNNVKDEILNPALINSPYVFDSAEVVFNKDEKLCKTYFRYADFLKNRTVIFKNSMHEAYKYRLSGYFYIINVLDKYLYSNKGKVKYKRFLAFFCYNYPGRLFIATPHN